jgi:hypothetical protein
MYSGGVEKQIKNRIQNTKYRRQKLAGHPCGGLVRLRRDRTAVEVRSFTGAQDACARRPERYGPRARRIQETEYRSLSAFSGIEGRLSGYQAIRVQDIRIPGYRASNNVEFEFIPIRLPLRLSSGFWLIQDKSSIVCVILFLFAARVSLLVVSRYGIMILAESSRLG